MFVFEHSPLAQVSALDRKRRRDELNLKAPTSLCPGGMSACIVPGIEGAYEVRLLLTSSGCTKRIETDLSALIL